MKQIEITSKLVLAIIGLTSVGALLVPTYAVPTIRSADIFDGEVKTADIANNAVTSSKIQDGQVTNADLANDAVTTGKIKNEEVTSADIKDATITSTDIAPGTIPPGGGGTPDDNSVTSAKIVNGEVKTEDLASDAVTLVVTQRDSDGISVSPGFSQEVQAVCLDDEVPTGGGFGISGGDLVVTTSHKDVGTNGWEVKATNSPTATEDGLIFAVAECAKLVP